MSDDLFFPSEPDDLGPPKNFDPRAKPKFETHAQPAPRKEPADKKPWTGMTYSQVLDAGFMPALEEHIVGLKPQAARDYALYLVKFCKFPAAFVARVQEEK